MAPIRRYLRISKYSVLECRIYLENPSDARWLLDGRDSVLLRVFKRIQPLVLPKLREENERAKAKKKSKPVKDVVVEGLICWLVSIDYMLTSEADEYEVSIFLRETGTRHSIVTRHKSFQNTGEIKSNSNKLTGNNDSPIQIADDGEPQLLPLMEEEEEEDSSINLQDIPEAESDDAGNEAPSRRRRRRRRAVSNGEVEMLSRPAKRNKDKTAAKAGAVADAQDEKKLGMSTTYEGYNIWGWILCLLITRRDRSTSSKIGGEQSGQALMEEWIATQVPDEP